MLRWHEQFDWKAAIALNRDALLHVLTALYALAGLKRFRVSSNYKAHNDALPLCRSVRSAILRILQPAESAARRLIVIAARGITAPHFQNRSLPDFKTFAVGKPHHLPAFQLFDPRKRFEMQNRKDTAKKHCPRISIILEPRFRPSLVTKPVPKDPSSKRLAFRIAALKYALENLDRQAMRLARANVKRAKLPAGPRRVGVMRPGLPPGHRTRHDHPVDALLSECHALAIYALEAPS